MKEELKKLAMRVDGQFKMAPLPIVCYDLQIEKDYMALYEYVAKACPANILALIESHEAVENQNAEMLAALKPLTHKFISGNSVSVERATITAEEWLPVAQAIAKHKGDV